MQEAHHDAPLRELEKLTDTTEFLKQQTATTGSRVFEGDGTQDLRKNSGRAQFDLT